MTSFGRGDSGVATSADDPTVAVVICTRDRPDSLRRTLQSVWTQSRRPTEVIVVDDGQLPADILHDCEVRGESAGIVWRYLRKDAPGLTRSRNVAARASAADILLYLDDDVTCGANVIEEFASIFRDPHVGAVTATVLEPTWTDLGARLFQFAYRVAGWWAIRPRSTPSTPRPAILRDRERVRPARWLSGAAMALRRSIVLAHPFDERLGGYALGEDREMTYRLAPQHRIIEARQARVIHRREGGARGDPWQSGFMTARNYITIIGQTCRPTIGDVLVLCWTFGVLAAVHVAFALTGRARRHLAEVAGMAAGIWQAVVRERPVKGPVGRAVLAVRYPSAGHRRRVAFVTNRLEHGGAEWMLITLARRLPAHGVDAVVYCLKDAGPLADECRRGGIPVRADLLRHKFDASVMRRLAERLRSDGVDVIIAAGSGGDRMFWSTLAGHWTGVPVVVWSHWFPTEREPRFERVNRALYRGVARFIALGRRHADALARIEHVPAGRIVVIRNGIVLERFAGAAMRSDARRRLDLSADQVGVAMIANLRPEKRHDVFIEAASSLAPRYPNARFFMIGDGPARDAVLAHCRRAEVRPEQFRWLGARDDVPVLLAGLDIVCLCSDVECFSLVMLEAAASGAAFIGPAAGSLDEFLEHGRTGLAIRPGDTASLVAALDALLSDAPRRRALAAAGQHRARAEFGIDRTASRFARLIEEVCSVSAEGRGSHDPNFARNRPAPAVRSAG
ncbi:MAG: glycosyltransferase [Phycisphaerae bacterium]|nr:glycosyltransferase [Phycisphaerae bacterium]